MSATAFALPPTLEEVERELSSVERELQRRRWARDPVAWATEKLGVTLWSGQVRIMEAVRDHRKTAALTCHEVGKSFSAALLAAWWIDTHKVGEAMVVTTAPTNDQVRIILWREIGRAHQLGNLTGRINQTEWKVLVGEREETVAIGRHPSEYKPTSFQGIHGVYVMIIIDEANGVRGPLREALDSLGANEGSKTVEIGNGDDPSGEFYENCKPGSGYAVVQISAFDSPNFTGEPIPEGVARQLIGKTYVEDKRRKWAPGWSWTSDGSRCVPPAGSSLEDTNPFWQSKVLGHFPVQIAEGSLIPLSWVRAAQERELPAGAPSRLGLDVGASLTGDASCCGHRQGGRFRVLYEERQPDTMKTTGRLIQMLLDPRYAATEALVDYIGVGRGVVDRAREQNLPVHPITVGEASTVLRCIRCKHEWDIEQPVDQRRRIRLGERCPQCGCDVVTRVFANMLSQLWWAVRGEFEAGLIDLDRVDDDLAAELLTITWEPNSKGQIVVKYAKDKPSPNRADSLLFAFAPVPAAVEEEFASW